MRKTEMMGETDCSRVRVFGEQQHFFTLRYIVPDITQGKKQWPDIPVIINWFYQKRRNGYGQNI